MTQGAGQGSQERLLVLDEQNGPATVLREDPLVGERACLSQDTATFRRDHRNESRARPVNGFHDEVAAEIVKDRTRDGQAQPRTPGSPLRRLGGEEWIEDALDDVRRD